MCFFNFPSQFDQPFAKKYRIEDNNFGKFQAPRCFCFSDINLIFQDVSYIIFILQIHVPLLFYSICQKSATAAFAVLVIFFLLQFESLLLCILVYPRFFLVQNNTVNRDSTTFEMIWIVGMLDLNLCFCSSDINLFFQYVCYIIFIFKYMFHSCLI